MGRVQRVGQLDGHLEHLVGLVDDPHSAAAQPLEDQVARQGLAMSAMVPSAAAFTTRFSHRIS
jgi:hypothetical protein